MVRWGNSLSMTFRCSNGIRQGGQLSPLLYNVYTDDLNHHLQATGVECYLGCAWVHSLSYADDMVLLAPTVTALETLLEVCRASGPHDIVYNTTKTVCMPVRQKQSQDRFSTRVGLGNEELSYVEEFRYLGHIITADCRYNKDIKKQFRRQNAVGNMLVRNSHLHLLRQKSNCSSRIVTPFMDVHFGVIHSRTLLENSLSVIVTLSSVLLTSPETPARVWHLR